MNKTKYFFVGYVIPVKTLSNRDLWLWQAGHKLKTPSGYFQIRQVPIGDPAVTSQVSYYFSVIQEKDSKDFIY